MTEPVACARCSRTDVDRLQRPPLPTDLGVRIHAEICAECWDEWKKRQMLLINHYGLKLHLPESREFLYTNMRAFLYGDGEGAEIDTGKEGSVDW